MNKRTNYPIFYLIERAESIMHTYASIALPVFLWNKNEVRRVQIKRLRVNLIGQIPNGKCVVT